MYCWHLLNPRSHKTTRMCEVMSFRMGFIILYSQAETGETSCCLEPHSLLASQNMHEKENDWVSMSTPDLLTSQIQMIIQTMIILVWLPSEYILSPWSSISHSLFKDRSDSSDDNRDLDRPEWGCGPTFRELCDWLRGALSLFLEL